SLETDAFVPSDHGGQTTSCLKYFQQGSDTDLVRSAMPIIRAVIGIIETSPSDQVSPRPPATRVPSAGREDHSKGQERQTADHAARLAQQAYQQQKHQATEHNTRLLDPDLS